MHERRSSSVTARNDLEPPRHRHVALVPTTLGRAFGFTCAQMRIGTQ